MMHNNDEFDNGEEKEMVAVEQNEEEKQYYNNIQPDSHTYNTLINVFGKHLKMNDVDYFVNEMQNNGMQSNAGSSKAMQRAALGYPKKRPARPQEAPEQRPAPGWTRERILRPFLNDFGLNLDHF